MGQRRRVAPTEDGYVYVVDLPGFGPDEIGVRLDDGALSIVAERADGDEFAARQRSVPEHVHVPGTVDGTAISASFTNGVLEITLPTTETDEDGHRIPVEE